MTTTTPRRSPQLGAATLGESGGQPMAPRIQAAWHGARISAPAYPGHVRAGRQPRDPRRGRRGAGRSRARRERRHRARARLLGRGAHDRRRGARHRGSRDRRRRARCRRARSARLPGVLDDDRVARRDRRSTRAGSAAAAIVGDVLVHDGDWIVGDADGVTVVAEGRHLDDVLAAGQAPEAKEQEFFEELRAGKTTIELLGSTRRRSPATSGLVHDAVQRVAVGVRDLAADRVVVRRCSSSYDHVSSSFDRDRARVLLWCGPSRRGTCSRGCRRPRCRRSPAT